MFAKKFASLNQNIVLEGEKLSCLE